MFNEKIKNWGKKQTHTPKDDPEKCNKIQRTVNEAHGSGNGEEEKGDIGFGLVAGGDNQMCRWEKMILSQDWHQMGERCKMVEF